MTEIVLGKYEMDTRDNSAFLGEGSFSAVRKGVNRMTGNPVAIKTYKPVTDKQKKDKVMAKFTHQVNVLEKLMKQPNFGKAASLKKSFNAANFKKMQMQQGNEDGGSFDNLLQGLKVSDYFVQLIDYSKNEDGSPGAAGNGCYYVVLEMAEYTLEDYLWDRRKTQRPMAMADVQRVFRDMVRIVSLLHAHDLVHLDIKPENIMRTRDGNWKLTDVDGAVLSSQQIHIDDNHICFTPIYCAPEFARAIIEDSDFITISRLMDVWSLGITSLDLVLAAPALEAKLAKCLEENGDCLGFLEWLQDITVELNVPKILATLDEDFFDLLQRNMLVKDPLSRASIPEVLAHPFFQKKFDGGGEWDKYRKDANEKRRMTCLQVQNKL